MRRFEVRKPDDSFVGDGVVFQDGQTVVHVGEVPALLVYPSVEVMQKKVIGSGWLIVPVHMEAVPDTRPEAAELWLASITNRVEA